MIENFLHPAVENRLEMWFQQGGVTPYTANVTMNLNE